MEFYLLGLRITGAIFLIVPWDTIPICLPQIYLQAVARETAPTSCTLASDITRWLGVATIMCSLPPLANRKMIAGALITAGVLACVIVFLYLVRPGNCRQPILPCHANDIYIVSSVSVVQMLLVVACLRKIVRREAPLNN
ncbi:MAG: hypothetical protein A2075_17090 [Geobacteraceae bacterium GWC2_58_44]|nr:MAG: hypothetical protein A2075_17090 [Geobacteraceae bacterium GWC2_58_44]